MRASCCSFKNATANASHRWCSAAASALRLSASFASGPHGWAHFPEWSPGENVPTGRGCGALGYIQRCTVESGVRNAPGTVGNTHGTTITELYVDAAPMTRCRPTQVFHRRAGSPGVAPRRYRPGRIGRLAKLTSKWPRRARPRPGHTAALDGGIKIAPSSYLVLSKLGFLRPGQIDGRSIVGTKTEATRQQQALTKWARRAHS